MPSAVNSKYRNVMTFREVKMKRQTADRSALTGIDGGRMRSIGVGHARAALERLAAADQLAQQRAALRREFALAWLVT